MVPCPGSMEKVMAPHSSTLAWKIPWTEEPGGLQSMGLLRVRYDPATSLSLFTFMHWRRKWQPTPVFLLGESQGPGSLVGCPLWCPTESDTTEAIWWWQRQRSRIEHGSLHGTAESQPLDHQGSPGQSILFSSLYCIKNLQIFKLATMSPFVFNYIASK